jgi:hypothetical protein
MVSNEILAEAVLHLASAIHHINMNDRSRSIAEYVRGIVQGAQQQDKAKELLAELKDLRASLTAMLQAAPIAADASAAPLCGVAAGATTADQAVQSAGERFEATLGRFAEFAPAVTAAAERRFAADPFAPVFEVEPGVDVITIKLHPRPGSVQYVVNVTGPRSSALKVESGLPTPTLVAQVIETPFAGSSDPRCGGVGPGSVSGSTGPV